MVDEEVLICFVYVVDVFIDKFFGGNLVVVCFVGLKVS